MSNVRTALPYARASTAAALHYRTALFTTGGLMLVQVFVLTRIWHALYGTHVQEKGLSVHATIVYLTVVNLQTLVMSSTVASVVSNRVRQGSVASDLGCPVGFVSQMLAWHAGEAVVLVTIGMFTVPLAMLVGGFGAPPTPGDAALYVVALALGWLVNALVATLLSLSAFWLVFIWPVSAVVRIVGQQFLAGTAVPLVFFPGLLQTTANVLPFQFLGCVPAAVYIGTLGGQRLGRDLLLGAAWLVVLAVAVRVVEGRARRKLTVAGG